MSTTAVVLLAVIAAATVITALAQLLLMIVLQRSAVTLVKVVQDVQRDVRPIIEQARVITTDAARIATIAVRQAERVDVAMSTVTTRVDETLSAVQRIVTGGPVAQGAAVWTGLRAVLAMFTQHRKGARDLAAEEDEGIFVG